MKPLIKNLFIALIGMLIMTSPMVTALSHVTGLSPVFSVSVILALSVVLYLVTPTNVSRKGNFVAGIQVEHWVNYIIQRFWKDNSFITRAWNDDQYVVGGKIVHIPQPGGAPNIVTNRSSFPATAVRRTDTDITYALNEYSTDPAHIQNAETVETSYDKINSVLGDQMGFLTEAVADQLLLSWVDEAVTTPKKLFTSGGVSAVGQDDFTGTTLTGTRNVMLVNDIKAVNLAFNLQKVPKQNRFGVIEANMYDQLLTDLSQTQYRDFSASMDPANGVLGKLYGITLLDRSSTVMYNTGNALKAYNAASVATDKYASIFWQQDCVSRAMGEVKMFEHIGSPLYYGDVYSALMRMGGRRRRGDDKGVISLIAA